MSDYRNLIVESLDISDTETRRIIPLIEKNSEEAKSLFSKLMVKIKSESLFPDKLLNTSKRKSFYDDLREVKASSYIDRIDKFCDYLKRKLQKEDYQLVEEWVTQMSAIYKFYISNNAKQSNMFKEASLFSITYGVIYPTALLEMNRFIIKNLKYDESGKVELYSRDTIYNSLFYKTIVKFNKIKQDEHNAFLNVTRSGEFQTLNEDYEINEDIMLIEMINIPVKLAYLVYNILVFIIREPIIFFYNTKIKLSDHISFIEDFFEANIHNMDNDIKVRAKQKALLDNIRKFSSTFHLDEKKTNVVVEKENKKVKKKTIEDIDSGSGFLF